MVIKLGDLSQSRRLLEAAFSYKPLNPLIRQGLVRLRQIQDFARHFENYHAEYSISNKIIKVANQPQQLRILTITNKFSEKTLKLVAIERETQGQNLAVRIDQLHSIFVMPHRIGTLELEKELKNTELVINKNTEVQDPAEKKLQRGMILAYQHFKKIALQRQFEVIMEI